jgi:hypothetical protein
MKPIESVAFLAVIGWFIVACLCVKMYSHQCPPVLCEQCTNECMHGFYDAMERGEPK